MRSARRRALRRRGVIACAAVAVLMAIVVIIEPGGPWFGLVIFFAVWISVVVVGTTFGDRRIDWQDGYVTSPLTSAAYSSSTQVSVMTTVPWERTVGLARRAIASVGGIDVGVIEPGVVGGWIGYSLTDVPSVQQHQVVIFIEATPDGGSQFTCCAWPRFKASRFGKRRSAQLAELLRRAVVDLAGPG